MKKTEKINRTRRLTVRFTDTEYKKIELSFQSTTKRRLSEYIRAALLDKPITVYTRDKSLDEMLHTLNLLKRELSAIGNNFNQAVKRLHTLDHIPEIKFWVEYTEKQRELFLEKTKEIHQQIALLSDQWLQE